jgi:hypothetical protein
MAGLRLRIIARIERLSRRFYSAPYFTKWDDVMPQTRFRTAVAWMVAALCLLTGLFLAWWFLALSIAIGKLVGLDQFHEARHRAQIIRIALIPLGLLLQVVGAIASGVAVGVEDGSMRGCLRRTFGLAFGFVLATATSAIATTVVIVAVVQPASVSFFWWAMVVVIICGIVLAGLLRIGSTRATTPIRFIRLI